MQPRQQQVMRQLIDQLMPPDQGSSASMTPTGSRPPSTGSSALQREEFRQTGVIPPAGPPSDPRQQAMAELSAIKRVASLDPGNRLLAQGIAMVEQAINRVTPPPQ